jgi:type IV secretion system protein VirB10
MTKFSLKQNPLSGVGSVHIKKSVKIAGLVLAGMMVVLVLLVIAQKGQRASASAQTDTPSTVNTATTASSLDSVLAKKPTSSVVKPTPITSVETAPATPSVSPELAAMKKRQLAEFEARQAMLTEAVYSGMNIQIDDAALRQTTAPAPSRELTMAQQRLDHAKKQAMSTPSGQALSQGGALDTTLASQASKDAFLASTHQAGYLNARRELPASEYELTVGTLIPAALISAVNSDTTGHLVAQVSQHVYDSATGSAILIPQGTRLYGTYDSRVAYGQRRLPVTWSRVNFPDGTKLDIGNMASLDVTGMSGLTGEVNNHYWRLFGQSTLLGGISGLTQAGVSDGDDDSRSTAESVADGVTQQYAETGNLLIRKNMNIQPTIEIDNAEPFYIMVSQDIVLPPYSSIR